MIEERIEWLADYAPVHEQLRLRNKGNTGPLRIIAKEQAILDREPRRDSLLDEILDTFWKLGTARSAVGRIPINVIWDFCRIRDMNPTTTEIWTTVLLRADAHYLATKAKKEAE